MLWRAHQIQVDAGYRQSQQIGSLFAHAGEVGGEQNARRFGGQLTIGRGKGLSALPRSVTNEPKMK